MFKSYNKQSKLEAFSAISLVLLVYSGVFKWMPFMPVDLTILGFLLAVFFTLLFLFKSPYIDKSSALFLGLTLFYFGLFVCTAIYTYSNSFWISKTLALLLNFVALMMPIVCLRNSHSHKLVENILITLGVIFAAIIMFIYQLGLLDLLLKQSLFGNDIETPDYLVLSVCIGIAAILLLTRGSAINYLLAIFCVLAMVLLTGRGPLLFFIIVSIIISFSKPRERNIFKKILSIIIFFALIAGLSFWEGAEGVIQRFSAIAEGKVAGAFRLDDIRISIGLIQEHLFFGVGIGGYGMAGFGIDENAYPHNLFLESLLETGLIGLLIFMTSIFYLFKSIYNYRNYHSVRPYIFLLIFISLNYMKSGGFIGARDLYFYIGLVFSAAIVAKKELLAKKNIS